jgi:hypothetical protein
MRPPKRVRHGPREKINRRRKPELTIQQILSWADIYHKAYGAWPTREDGRIFWAKGENWMAVNGCLIHGHRGLPGGFSLSQLLAQYRGLRNVGRLPPLSEAQVLRWADEHHRRTGSWPHLSSGTIPDSGGEKWINVDQALGTGHRNLPGGSSLAELLTKQRGVRYAHQAPRLTYRTILRWADAHHKRTGKWPTIHAGPIADAPGETWIAVQTALANGQRGLPGGSTLPMLLAAKRNVRNYWTRPRLTIEETLAWADAFHERTGQWPRVKALPIAEAPEETWHAVDAALRGGGRGLPGGSSLPSLLASQRGARNNYTAPQLRRRQILAWADAHHRRTGAWPNRDSGPIAEAPGDTWAAIDAALHQSCRGLSFAACSSLAQLLAKYRGCKNHQNLPPLSCEQILVWADSHFARKGVWPRASSGRVRGTAEDWRGVNKALVRGGRGLPGGSSLAKLLANERGVPHRFGRPPLTDEQILEWAEHQYRVTGSWPNCKSGPIIDVPGETWVAVDTALSKGQRGMPGGSSLAKLLAERWHIGRWARRQSRAGKRAPGSTARKHLASS